MPKKSSGCVNCRWRKVKCDDTKPTCKRCAVRGDVCQGYTPKDAVVWRDQTRSVIHKAQIEAAEARSRSPEQKPPAPTEVSTVSRLQSSIDISSDRRALLFANFLEGYLPKETPLMPFGCFYGFVTQLPTVAAHSPALANAVEAVCLTQIGTLNSDQTLIGYSRDRYGLALRQLARGLSNVKPETQDYIYASMTFLALIDFYGPVSLRGWTHHVDGIEKFVINRGPASMKNKFALAVFENTRHSAVNSGLLRRHRLPYAAPEWLEVTRQASKVDSFSALRDVLVQVPGALEESDNAFRDFPDSNMRTLFADTARLLGKLKACYARFTTEHADPLYTAVPASDVTVCGVSADRAPYPFSSIFEFPSRNLAAALTLYWVALFALNTELARILLAENSAELSDNTALLDAWIEADTSLRNACQTFHYLLNPHGGVTGRIAVVLPLVFATIHFKRTDQQAEFEWCLVMDERLRELGITSPTPLRERLLED